MRQHTATLPSPPPPTEGGGAGQNEGNKGGNALLIVGLLTPSRRSSLLSRMHSRMISSKLGWSLDPPCPPPLRLFAVFFSLSAPSSVSSSALFSSAAFFSLGAG